MEKVHSHYENLKVSRDAPPEVIRAAYKSLSLKYHPDRNQSNSEAARIMAMLNLAYETLSDPEKRRQHDAWIAATEGSGSAHRAEPKSATSSTRNGGFTVDETKVRQAAKSAQSFSYNAGRSLALALRNLNLSTLGLKLGLKAGRILMHVLRNWFWYGFATLVIIGWNEKPSPPPPGPKPYVAAPSPRPYVAAPAPTNTPPAYIRPTTAPNGQPWPTSSGYIGNYQRLHRNGLSNVTVDNSQNDSDVFIKLVSLDGPQAYPVRTFFISAHGSFTLKQVTAGSYDIRYRDLNTGGLSRSEAFNLEETPTANGTQFSDFTMTLYKVRNGNMKTYGLAEGEF